MRVGSLPLGGWAVGVVSFVSVVPEWVAAAATDVAGIGSVVGAANAAAAGA
ncbi:PE domain-containing protein, partial [Mycobacterium marinum]